MMEDLHRVTVLAQCDEEPVRHDLGCHWEVRTVAVYPSSVICKAVSCILSGGPITKRTKEIGSHFMTIDNQDRFPSHVERVECACTYNNVVVNTTQ